MGGRLSARASTRIALKLATNPHAPRWLESVLARGRPAADARRCPVHANGDTRLPSRNRNERSMSIITILIIVVVVLLVLGLVGRGRF
jgi:hypothetical protein